MKREIQYIVEHVEPELFPWSRLEYQHMAMHLRRLDPSGRVRVTNCAPPSDINDQDSGLIYTSETYTYLINEDEMRTTILLDPEADEILTSEDGQWATGVICGGILGTDEMEGPVVDRTAEVRNDAVIKRHLGPVQMTADTAMIVSMEVLSNGRRIEDMQFVDRPTFQLDKYESIEMPFRYLLDKNGSILIADGMQQLWREQNDFDLDDFQ